jgi:phospholipase/lecithinase/hemolysin
MKSLTQKLFQFSVVILLFGSVLSTRAAFTSLYVFGDALSTTTNNSAANQYYYGNRYSNGRVWVEVLAQRQGIPVAMNWSYFDCNSSNLVKNVNNFNISPSAAANALVVVWVNNSDLFDAVMTAPNTNQSTWTAIINRGQTNQLQAITTLYNKGVRTLVMPNSVDVGKVPYFYLNNPNFGATAPFIRQECIAYNVAFSNTLNLARAACPGLAIYRPNFFGLLDNVISNTAFYGLTNAFDKNGASIDAMDAINYGFPKAATNGFGSNFVFWDYLDPSARFHAIIADVAQQIISPVQIGQITAFAGSNRLDIANAPIGLNGFVESCTNLALANWAPLTNFSSINTAQSLFAPTPSSPTNVSSKFVPEPKDIAPGPGGTVVVTALQFYRLHFPYTWVWP